MGTTYRIGTIIPLFFLRIRGNTLVAGLSPTVRVLNASDGLELLNETPLSEVTPGVYVYSWAAEVSVFTQCIEIYRVGQQEFANQFIIDRGASINNIVQIEVEVSTPEIETNAYINPETSIEVFSVTNTRTDMAGEISDIQGTASNTVSASTTLEPTVDGVAELEC